jgi:transcriptional regulator with XRE-family HTH domain
MSLAVNVKEQTKRSRPKYTLEFKQDAAKLVNEKGYTHQQAADNLGIWLSAISRWSQASKPRKSTKVWFYGRTLGVFESNRSPIL